MAENKLNLLLELLSEEIPAGMQAMASKKLLEAIHGRLRHEQIDASSECSIAASTPRRISLLIPGLEESVRDEETPVRGPRDGAPMAAVEGFARKHGVSVSQLKQGKYKNQNYYFWTRESSVRLTRDILPEILESEITSFTWPKSMRWGTGEELWVRPLHSILCILFNEREHKTVDFRIGAIKSGNRTRGHGFMSPETFAVKDFESYENGLRRAQVLLCPKERRQRILDEARTLSSLNGRELIEDQELLDEVAGLVEWPSVLIGNIDRRFQELPSEILRASMKKHQKYLSARDPKSGKVTHFIVVANRETEDGGATILAGNKRVLTARLEDAEFFLANDQRTIDSVGLAGMAGKLRSANYHSKLGNQGERSERMAKLARRIALQTGADVDASERAARWAKADLVSDVVGEFPDLQGVAGRYYAISQGLSKSVATAIEQHYSPSSASDNVPRDAVSVVVGLADRIDHLAGMIGIGEMPTGSKDPQALRRSAIGIIRLILENEIRLPLAEAFRFATGQYSAAGNQGAECELAADEEVVAEALGFIRERLKVYLRDRGMRHDVLDACLNAARGDDDIISISRRTDALAAFIQSEETSELTQGFRRVNNILNAEEKVSDLPSTSPVLQLSKEPAERDLMKAVEIAFQQITDSASREDFFGAFNALAGLRRPIDSFFENVRVNVGEPKLRRNRISVLMSVRHLFEKLADFSRLE